MQRRKIPCLDSYFDKIMLLLWPKFKIIFDLNLMSIIDCDVNKLLNNGTNNNDGNNNNSKGGNNNNNNSSSSTSTSIHYITRRYVDFTISIYKLYFTIYFNNDERIEANLDVLKSEFNNLLIKIVEQNKKKSMKNTSSSSSSNKSQMIFLIRFMNKYYH